MLTHTDYYVIVYDTFLALCDMIECLMLPFLTLEGKSVLNLRWQFDTRKHDMLYHVHYSTKESINLHVDSKES